MLSDDEVVLAAKALHNAESTGVQIRQLTQQHPSLSMDDAYRIQHDLVAQKVTQGERIVGWKIGLTSKAMRAALNIDIPDSGVLLDSMVFESGESIPKSRFIEPRVEAEIAFVMKASPGGKAANRDSIIAATEYVCPSIEILDTRIQRIDAEAKTTRKVEDTISDNAANAGVVLSNTKHAITDLDLRWVGAIVRRNGDVEETGLGAGVLDDPIESVAWLAHRLADYGEQIEPGQIILSGSFIRPIECPPGSNIEADFGTFGTVSINFASD